MDAYDALQAVRLQTLAATPDRVTSLRQFITVDVPCHVSWADTAWCNGVLPNQEGTCQDGDSLTE